MAGVRADVELRRAVPLDPAPAPRGELCGRAGQLGGVCGALRGVRGGVHARDGAGLARGRAVPLARGHALPLGAGQLRGGPVLAGRLFRQHRRRRGDILAQPVAHGPAAVGWGRGLGGRAPDAGAGWDEPVRPGDGRPMGGPSGGAHADQGAREGAAQPAVDHDGDCCSGGHAPGHGVRRGGGRGVGQILVQGAVGAEPGPDQADTGPEGAAHGEAGVCADLGRAVRPAGRVRRRDHEPEPTGVRRAEADLRAGQPVVGPDLPPVRERGRADGEHDTAGADHLRGGAASQVRVQGQRRAGPQHVCGGGVRARPARLAAADAVHDRERGARGGPVQHPGVRARGHAGQDRREGVAGPVVRAPVQGPGRARERGGLHDGRVRLEGGEVP